MLSTSPNICSIFRKGNNFHDSLFASLEDQTLQKKKGAKSFLLKLTPLIRKENKKMVELHPMKVFPLKCTYNYTYKGDYSALEVFVSLFISSYSYRKGCYLWEQILKNSLHLRRDSPNREASTILFQFSLL